MRFLTVVLFSSGAAEQVFTTQFCWLSQCAYGFHLELKGGQLSDVASVFVYVHTDDLVHNHVHFFKYTRVANAHDKRAFSLSFLALGFVVLFFFQLFFGSLGPLKTHFLDVEKERTSLLGVK